MKIGFQGISGSYSEKAAILLAAKSEIKKYELIPLVSSKQVIEAIKIRKIDLGVVAVRNSTAGSVKETEMALKDGLFTVLKKASLSINHAIFFQNNKVTADKIKFIKSHEQALRQSKKKLNSLFPNAEIIPIEDTAIGAARLADNEYGPNVAVVCSRDTGEAYRLHLFKENVQDEPNNQTEFVLLKGAS